MRDHPGMAVALRYQVGIYDVTFTRGTPPANAESSTISLHNGWTGRTFGSVEATRHHDGPALPASSAASR